MQVLSDPSAERAVIAGIIKHGEDAYYDVADIISSSTFVVEVNSVIFKCLKKLIESSNTKDIDVVSIYSTAKELELEHILRRPDEAKHLNSVISTPVSLNNVRKFAGKIRKLEIARLLYKQLENTQDDILQIKGDESITQILGMAENSIFDFTTLLNDKNEESPELIYTNLKEYVEYLANNSVDQVGTPTGYPTYDKLIGGGWRRGTVNVLGARMKGGKSTIKMNIALHISKELKIPVLDLDTEMQKRDNIHKLLANLSNVEIDTIETGKFNNDLNAVVKINNAVEELNIPYYYKNIAGRSFEDILAIMRRWIVQTVGLKTDGTAKPCVIMYDYLKLMDSNGLGKDLKEHQLLGFMMTGLHNFAVRYDVPIGLMIQLNRDGITKESTDVVAGSDRIGWLCTSLAILKDKSDEEIDQDGHESGNKKLVPIVSRYGPANGSVYISMKMQGEYGRVKEAGRNIQKKDFEIEYDDDDGEIPFI